jgi:hypothetical protein
MPNTSAINYRSRLYYWQKKELFSAFKKTPSHSTYNKEND